MTGRLEAMRAWAARATHAAGHALRAGPATLATARARHADSRARAICPIDDWAFVPLYTDGTCPLCGWDPPGYRYHPPLLHRLDWFWVGLFAMAVVSAVMLIAVLNAYSGA